MSKRLLSMREVLSRTTFSKTHIYRLIKAKSFPKPVPLGLHRVAFLESEVEAWIAGRVADRDG